jgi:hypothetical protein
METPTPHMVLSVANIINQEKKWEVFINFSYNCGELSCCLRRRFQNHPQSVHDGLKDADTSAPGVVSHM